MQSIPEWGAGVIDISSISCNWFATRALQPIGSVFDSPNVSRFILFIYRIASLPYYYLFDHFQSFTSLPSNMSLQDLLLHYSCPPLVYTYFTSTFGSFSKCRSGVNLTNRFRFPLFCQPIGKRKTRAAI